MQLVSGRIKDVYLFVKYFYVFPESTQQTGRQKWAYTQDLSHKDFICLCTAQSLPGHTWLDMLTPYANPKTMQCQPLKHHLFSLGSRLGAALSHAPLWSPSWWADRRKQKGMLLGRGAACWQQLPHSDPLKIKHCKSVTALRFSLIQLKTNQYKLWTGAFFLTYILHCKIKIYTPLTKSYPLILLLKSQPSTEQNICTFILEVMPLWGYIQFSCKSPPKGKTEYRSKHWCPWYSSPLFICNCSILLSNKAVSEVFKNLLKSSWEIHTIEENML